MPTTATDPVIKRELPNGLTVLLKQDRSTPIVAVNVWFGVGSVNETEEINGLAHFQEHMVFKGTEKYGVGEISNIVKAHGGNLNAGTSYSYTMYYVVLPSQHFRTALEVQADAMMNSTFAPEEFVKERVVVIDEARMYDDRPESFTFYRTMELGFSQHNYRRPIAGYEPIVEKITRDQLVEFYNNYYRPSNAVLVVVGDIDPDEAMPIIEQAYGQWRAGDVEMGESPVEPPQTELRYQGFEGNIDHAYMGAGFHIPSITHEDYPVLEMISELLSAGRSSRLYQEVKEKKRLVTSAGASVLAEKWPGFFLFRASMADGKHLDATSAIFAEVERLKHEPVSLEELDKAQRQLERSLFSSLETVEGQASQLGYYQLLGDYNMGDKHRDAIATVSPEQVMAVARRYFTPSNCSLVLYGPDGCGTRELSVEDVTRRVSAVLTDHAPATDALPRTAVTGSRATKKETPAGKVEVHRLDNGVRVLVKQRPLVPLVTMATSIDGGGRAEPEGQDGVSSLAHRVLTKGSYGLTAEEMVERVESMGGTIESVASYDAASIYLNSLASQMDQLVPIYRDVVRDALFDEERTQVEKEKMLEDLARHRDNPVQLAIDTLYHNVYGTHPYAHRFLGDESQFSQLTGVNCRDWYESRLCADSLVVSFVGDISPELAIGFAEKVFGDLPRGTANAVSRAVPARAERTGEHIVTKPGVRQGVALAGYTAPSKLTDEAAAMEVLNGVLTGLGGRLFVELRDKRSLGYMTGSAFAPLKDGGIFFGYANPTPDEVALAIEVIQTELARVSKAYVSEEELHRSREWLMGSHVMQLQKNSSQALAYGAYEALGYGWQEVDRIPERLAKVDLEAMRDVARAYFAPEHAAIVKLLPDA